MSSFPARRRRHSTHRRWSSARGNSTPPHRLSSLFTKTPYFSRFHPHPTFGHPPIGRAGRGEGNRSGLARRQARNSQHITKNKTHEQSDLSHQTVHLAGLHRRARRVEKHPRLSA